MDSSTVQVMMDPIFCNASVDFNAHGESKTQPSNLTMTVWRQSRYATTGIFTKNAIVFTDPSGTLASPVVPLKTWIQLQKNFVGPNNLRGPAPSGCIKNGSSLVFKDQRKGDSKLVTVSENQVTLAPFGSSNNDRFYLFFNPRRWIPLPLAALSLCAKI